MSVLGYCGSALAGALSFVMGLFSSSFQPRGSTLSLSSRPGAARRGLIAPSSMLRQRSRRQPGQPGKPRAGQPSVFAPNAKVRCDPFYIDVGGGCAACT